MDVCLFGLANPWDTKRTLCLYKMEFVIFYIR